MRLITGGNGLIGRQLQGEIRPSSRALDLIDLIAVEDFIANTEPTEVIHAAARVGGLYANMQDNYGFFEHNLQMNMNLLWACKEHGVKKFVGFLSTCIFPNNAAYPLTEKQIHDGPPHPSNCGYAYAKRMLDVQVRLARRQFGLDYKCIIPTNVYGPGDNFHLEQGHVIPALIHRCYIAKQLKTQMSVYGDGSAMREFIYSKDVAHVAEWMLDNYHDEEPLIVSTSQEVSIKHVVEMIVEIMGFDGKVVYDTNKPNGQHRKPTDTTKLRTVYPDFNPTSLFWGLKETIDWFVENYNHPDTRL